MHCVRCSVSIQVDIFVLATKDLQMQTHLVPKIMHQNFAIILRQFNYSKNSFIIMVPGKSSQSGETLCPRDPGAAAHP